ncbi:MAG: hypothetical protein ACTSRI_10830 [Promethearchaeota archaeon]
MAENVFFSQKLKIKKRYFNRELNLLQYFHDKTKKIYPENVIVINDFIFFFVSNEYYFRAKLFLHSMRKQLNKKVLIIRDENILINLLFSFFPDTYIHDIKLRINEQTRLKFILVCFLSYKERGIAIGRSGDYIKAINTILNKYINFKKKVLPLEIKIELINL